MMSKPKYGTVSIRGSMLALLALQFVAAKRRHGTHPAEMPTLPQSYMLIMEINRVNSLETINVHEYFDFSKQRLRTELYDDGGKITVVRDFLNNKKYTITDPDVHDEAETDTFRRDGKCAVEEDNTFRLPNTPDNDAKIQASFNANTLHMKDPHSAVMFSNGGVTEKFVGFDYARGIHSTQWFANSTETETIDGHTITTHSTRNHWFSAPDWSDAACVEGDPCNLQLPIRSVSEGTVYNHTSKKTEAFHDHYEYVSFIPGHPPAFLFHPEKALSCISFVGQAPKQFKLPSISTKSKKNKLISKTQYDASRGMPRPPRDYTVYMEINRVNTKETINVREFFDFDGNRVRTDMRDGNKMVSVIDDFNTMTKYRLVDDDLSDDPTLEFSKSTFECTMEPLNAVKSRFMGVTRHMKSPSEVFMFSPSGNERYIGLDYARGIHATQWFANSTETEEIDGHAITTHSTRNHWFSAPDWTDANYASCDGKTSTQWVTDIGKVVSCADMEAPVRTGGQVSEGTVFNHTTGLTSTFHDHYEYISFLPGKPAAEIFDPKTTMDDKACLPKLLNTPKKMPELPSAYITTVEINRVNTLETLNVHQYFDFESQVVRAHQAVRVDVYDNGGVSTVIHDYAQNLKYTLKDPDVTDDPEVDTPVDDKCIKETESVWKQPLQPHSYKAADMIQGAMQQSVLHLADPREGLVFDGHSGEKDAEYVGKGYARGILCTQRDSQWFANATLDLIIDDHLLSLDTRRNMWFSTPDWSDPGCAEGKDCNLQLPIRSVSEGTVYNHTSKKTEAFHDHYEYVSFIPGHPPRYLFEPESDGIKCSPPPLKSGAQPEPEPEPEPEMDDDYVDSNPPGELQPLNPGLEIFPNYVPGQDKINYPLPKLTEYSKKHKLTSSSDYNASRGMPHPPSQYTVYLEINKVNTKETINVREYFDFPGKRVRTDMRDGNKMVSVIRDFNTNWLYTLVDEDLSDNPSLSFEADQFHCTKQPLKHAMSSFAGRTRHMKSPSEVFMFSPSGNERYIGLDYARGIHATQWFANSEETSTFNGHILTTHSTRNHWFSAPDWSDANCDADGTTYGGYLDCAELQAPVRTVAEGTVFNHTSGKTIKFHDHYEYISFMPGKPPRDLFTPEQSEGHECKVVLPSSLDSSQEPWERAGVLGVSKDVATVHGSGDGAGPSTAKKLGVFVLVCMIGGVVGWVFVKVRKRRAESAVSWGVSGSGGAFGSGNGLTPTGIAASSRPDPYGRTGSTEALTDAI